MENKVSPAALICLQAMATILSAAKIDDEVYKKGIWRVGKFFHDAGVI